MSSVYVEVLLFHLNDRRLELASLKVNVTKLSLDPIHVLLILAIQEASLKAVCLSESAGAISFMAEQKLLVNRILSTSGEMLFSLLELISLLLTRPAGRGAVGKPGLKPLSRA